VQRINEAAFLDISQAFDKVWHRQSLSQKYYLIQKSYLYSRYFLVKVEKKYTERSPVPLLYFLHTTDLPASPESTTGTFADDTAVIAKVNDPAIVSHKLQTCIQFNTGVWNGE
jgi:hypothetical protein